MHAILSKELDSSTNLEYRANAFLEQACRRFDQLRDTQAVLALQKPGFGRNSDPDQDWPIQCFSSRMTNSG
uniref:Uncharacterized protein n=1 Tax=Romanomermis culicivorax TaxID=13658 RepID=A0A915K448_ROMCU